MIYIYNLMNDLVINTTIILIFSYDYTNIKLSTFKDLVVKLRP